MLDMSTTSTDVRFADEMGLLLNGQGFPRIAGRVLGWLLVCEPAEQSLTDLTKALDVSKASASTAARLLVRLGVAERALGPGARHDYIRMNADAGVRMFRQRTEFAAELQRTTERGLEMLHGAPAPRRARLERMRRLAAFLEREMRRLLEEFEAEEQARRR
jgi:DNA-binding transcriptional regulator GbsR (MarR family)